MKIIHRARPADEPEALPVAAEPAAPALATSRKAPRLSCCCRISELIPLVRQLHDEARVAQLAAEPKPAQAA